MTGAIDTLIPCADPSPALRRAHASPSSGSGVAAPSTRPPNTPTLRRHHHQPLLALPSLSLLAPRSVFREKDETQGEFLRRVLSEALAVSGQMERLPDDAEEFKYAWNDESEEDGKDSGAGVAGRPHGTSRPVCFGVSNPPTSPPGVPP